MGLNLIQGVTSRWERGDVGELQGVRMAMGLEEIQVGDTAAGVYARLNLIQATPGVSWDLWLWLRQVGRNLKLDEGQVGWSRVWIKNRLGDGVMWGELEGAVAGTGLDWCPAGSWRWSQVGDEGA